MIPAKFDSAVHVHPRAALAMQNQAPGHFHFNILRGLYWKIVPFRHI